MFTTLQRVFKFALTDLYRNKGRSVAAIFVLIITIALVTGLFFLGGLSNFIISAVENKIDITAYFKPEASEQDILSVRDQILQMSSGIKSVEYVSKDDALRNFTEKHKDNPVFSNALTQVGDNPFLPSLNITTIGDTSQYEKVATILQSSQYSNLIDKVDFSQKKATIEKVFSVTSHANTLGLALTVILVLVVILVVFNTIKLAIDSAKEEISTMRIVGASSWFVRSPFIIQGAIFGFVSFLVCFFSTFLLAYFFSPGLVTVLSGFNVFGYFISHLWNIILIQLGFGVGLGIFSSFIVVQKYLKV